MLTEGKSSVAILPTPQFGCSPPGTGMAAFQEAAPLARTTGKGAKPPFNWTGSFTRRTALFEPVKITVTRY